MHQVIQQSRTEEDRLFPTENRRSEERIYQGGFCMKTEVNFEEMEAFYNDLLKVQKEHLPDCTIGSFLIGFLNYVSLNCRRPDFIDNEALRMCLPAYAVQLEEEKKR